MAQESLSGSSTYIDSTSYAVGGRVKVHILGSSLKTDYGYSDWNNQGGRLSTLKAGASGSCWWAPGSRAGLAEIPVSPDPGVPPSIVDPLRVSQER